MTDILVKLAAVLALLAALYFGEQYIEGRGYDRAKAEDMAQIEAQKTEAATTLAAETEKVRERERYLNAELANQNLKDSEHEKIVADMSDRVRRAAGPAGRLRDPHAPGCGGGGGGPQAGAVGGSYAGATDPAQADGLLSVSLTDLLESILQESDDINAAYTSCRADAYTVRGEQLPP